ncbi:putative protein phosphatase 2C 13 [Cucumis melo var. makuwa]|uniref:Uncharacterized protein n=1 Tax=Cucumis melo var. makuwa TaxID=1194695 RepID=A0A5D3BU13_CUCMM|nr:putative protein phosphatase 2C 13 [Cucumis melo var. makuwa]
MVAEAEIKCPKSLPLMKINYHLRVTDDRDLQIDLPHPSSSPVFSQVGLGKQL